MADPTPCPRVAKVRTVGGLQTPAAFIYAKKGLPINITPDLYKHLPNLKGLQQPLHDLIGMECARSTKDGLRKMLTMDSEQVIYTTIWDPLTCVTGPANNNGISINTVKKGRVQLKCESFMADVKAMQPHMVALLSDHLYQPTSKGRVRKATTRTVDWARQCVKRARTLWHDDSDSDDKEKKKEKPSSGLKAICIWAGGEYVIVIIKTVASTSTTSSPSISPRSPAKQARPLLFGVVEGGEMMDSRRFCAQALSDIEGLDGFVVAGLGQGESTAARQEILRTVLACLPVEKPVVASVIHSPLQQQQQQQQQPQVLECVSHGVDLFESCYPYRLTCKGCALTFQHMFDKERAPSSAEKTENDTKEEEEEEEEEKKNDIALFSSKINLWDPKYKLDTSPIFPTCGCYACKTYSRAYLHHLLNTHEMLAQVLLQLHNIYHFQAFFQEIRRAISESRFTEYREQFERAFDAA
eukprot:jgi/Bigna1/130507/aug1.11_g5215